MLKVLITLLTTCCFINSWVFSGDLNLEKRYLNNTRTLDQKLNAERSQGKKVQKVQNFLKKGRANLNRSKSELGDHNKKILQQITRHRSELGEQNRRLFASFRMKEIQS